MSGLPRESYARALVALGLLLVSVLLSLDVPFCALIEDGIGDQPHRNAAAVSAGAGIGKLGKKGFDEALCKFYTGGCFAAGTLVHTPSGPVPIEALRPRDWVVTVDVATGERCAEQVLGVSAIEAERMVELAMPDGETLRATAEHPFWTERGWKAAALAAEELGAGAKEFSHREVVYNLEVKANHTYLVGRAGWVVHNACPNAGGRLGGSAHRKKVQEVVDDIRRRGLTPVTERGFPVPPGGHKGKRYADVVALDKDDNVVEVHQVGLKNKNNSPVSRERAAMDDLRRAQPTEPYFHPYN